MALKKSKSKPKKPAEKDIGGTVTYVKKKDGNRPVKIC